MRPRRSRKIYNKPASRIFSSADGKGSELSPIILALDEYEALRLADLEGLYQSEAAEYMEVSRQTFGRIIREAHKKIAEHLVYGNSLIIKGGTIEYIDLDIACDACGHQWTNAPERIEDLKCPSCDSNHVIHNTMKHHLLRNGHGRGGKGKGHGHGQGGKGHGHGFRRSQNINNKNEQE